jgi:hypothetical protein
MSVKRAKLVILAVSTLAVPLLMAQVRSLEERTATMSDRECPTANSAAYVAP